MKKLRDVPLRYYVAALVCGGISLILFGMVFALLRQADRLVSSPAWDWALAALIGLIAASGASFALAAWGALSDPMSRFGSLFREESVWVTQFTFWNAALWVGFSLVFWAVFWAGVYDPLLSLAVFLCWALLLLLFVRRAFKSHIEALDDPNDQAHASRLIGKAREPTKLT